MCRCGQRQEGDEQNTNASRSASKAALGQLACKTENLPAMHMLLARKHVTSAAAPTCFGVHLDCLQRLPRLEPEALRLRQAPWRIENEG
jgi:hypothetical protein